MVQKSQVNQIMCQLFQSRILLSTQSDIDAEEMIKMIKINQNAKLKTGNGREGEGRELWW